MSRARFAIETVGLTACWFFFPPGIMTQLLHTDSASQRGLAYSAILFLTVGLVCVAALVFHARLQRGAMRHRVLTFLAVEAIALWCAVTGLATSSGWPFAVSLVGIAGSATSYVALIIAWALALSRESEREQVALLPCSLVVYAVLSILGVGTASVPVAVDIALVCASGVCWLFATSPIGGTEASGDGESAPMRRGDPAAPPEPAARSPFAASKGIPFAPLALILLFLISGRTAVGLFFDYQGDLGFVELVVRGAAIIAVMAFFLTFLRGSKHPYDQLHRIWIPVMVAFIFGALVEIAFPNANGGVGCGIINAMLCCFECIACEILLRYSGARQVSIVAVASAGLLIFKVVPILVQRCIVPPLVHLPGVPDSVATMATMFIVMVIVSTVLAFLNRRQAMSDEDAGADRATAGSDTNPDSPSRRTNPRLTAISERYGLTSRETEIVGLIANGNSQKRVGELLGLSYSTVQSYAKEIYAKLGIHSKQQLVDLVHSTDGQTGE